MEYTLINYTASLDFLPDKTLGTQRHLVRKHVPLTHWLGGTVGARAVTKGVSFFSRHGAACYVRVRRTCGVTAIKYGEHMCLYHYS